MRDATTMPTSGRLQAVHRLIHKQHADPVHALITERMQRVIPRGNVGVPHPIRMHVGSQESETPFLQAFTIGPLFMSVLSEGLRLLQVFKDRKMVVSTSRKRKAAVGASE